MNTNNEEWRGIEGFPKYEVSNKGRVRSWAPRGRTSPSDPEARTDAPKVLKLQTQGGYHEMPYLRVVLRRNGKGHNKYVHQLVTEAWHGPRPTGMVTRHLNGEPQDNRLENLVWGTRAENAADQAAHGRAVFTKDGPLPPALTEREVIEIHLLSQQGMTVTDIARRYPHVNRNTVSYVVNGRSRKNVIKEFNEWLDSRELAAVA